MQSHITIDAETPDQPEVSAFFTASEVYMAALYPAESNHFVDVGALMRPDVIFLVARNNGRAAGCGAVIPAQDGSGEIKRMWVDLSARGLKVGKSILQALEVSARARGIRTLRLETGVSQPEALGLYRITGYAECAPFGNYQPDPLSVFMEKTL